MTRHVETGRLSLSLSIAGTIALVCLLALGPAYGGGDALALTSDDDARPTGLLPPTGTSHDSGTMMRVALGDTDDDAAGTVFCRHIWYAATNFLGAVPDDGALSEWAPHYFVAHSYGPYGQDILMLETGDAIVVNGSLVTVEGAVVAPKFSAYDQIMDAVGWDATVFQTCIPDTELCLFVYARGAASTLEAANEARAFAGLPTYAVDATYSAYEAYGAQEAGSVVARPGHEAGTTQAASLRPASVQTASPWTALPRETSM